MAVKLLRARESLGLKADFWNPAKAKAYRQLGQFIGMPTPKILMVTNFETMDQIKRAVQILGEIASDPVEDNRTRVNALKGIALAVESQIKMSAHILELAEKSDKKPVIEKKRNRPPLTVAVQINNSPVPQPVKPLNDSSGQNATPLIVDAPAEPV